MQSREPTRDEEPIQEQIQLPATTAVHNDQLDNDGQGNGRGNGQSNGYRAPASAFVVAADGVTAAARASTDGKAGQPQEPAQRASAQPSKWAVFAVIAIGVFMATLDSSIVNISLPAIGAYFNVPLNGSVEWVIISYLVVIAATLLTIGRLADMIGRKYIWLTGLIIFTLGSALSGASPSLALLIAARAFQGLGGSLIMAISPAMLTSAFPASERGRALGLNALTVALGVSAGPTLGGVITQSLSWRWIFYVNVPIGILGVILTLTILKERLQRNRGQFDPLGAVLLGVGLASLTLGLSFGQEWGWTSPQLIISLIVGVVPLVALVFVERWVKSPIVRFELLKDRVFASANLSLILSFLALFAVSFMLPFYLEQLRGFSVIESGLLLTPLPLMIAVLAPLSGVLADRFGTRWLAASGLAIACIGLVLISQLDAQSSLFDIIWRLAFTGVGQALFQSPNNSALMGAAPRGQQGVASGFLATGRVVGQSLSVALAGAVFASLGGSAAGIALTIKRQGAHIMAPVATLESQFAHAFQVTFLVCAAICAIGIAASLVRGKS